MTLKKLLLILSLILSSGLVAAGVVYAQEKVEPQEPRAAAAPQQPRTPPTTPEPFSIFIDGGTFLGVYAEDINRENMGRYGLREVRGVGITEIVKDSPAEKAGLRKDDVVLRFEGESVTSVRKLNRLVNEAAPDHTVRLTISRGGAEQEVSVTLAKRNEFSNEIALLRRGGETLRTLPRGGFPQIDLGQGGMVFGFGANRRLGVSTQSLTKQLAEYFGAKDGGLLITSVAENSAAAKAGLKAGDVITAVDGEKVESAGDLTRGINKKQDGEVELTIIRDRNTRAIKVTPEKAPNARRVRPEIMSSGRVVIPRIELPVIPEMDIQMPTIQIPRIVLPSIPEIEMTLPSRSPVTQVRPIRFPI